MFWQNTKDQRIRWWWLNFSSYVKAEIIFVNGQKCHFMMERTKWRVMIHTSVNFSILIENYPNDDDQSYSVAFEDRRQIRICNKVFSVFANFIVHLDTMDLMSWNWKYFWTFLCEISLLSYHFLPSRKLVCHLQGTRSDFVSIRKVKSNYYEPKNYVFKTFSVRLKILDSTGSNGSVRDRDAVDSSVSKQIFIRNRIPMIIKRFIK